MVCRKQERQRRSELRALADRTTLHRLCDQGVLQRAEPRSSRPPRRGWFASGRHEHFRCSRGFGDRGSNVFPRRAAQIPSLSEDRFAAAIILTCVMSIFQCGQPPMDTLGLVCRFIFAARFGECVEQ